MLVHADCTALRVSMRIVMIVVAVLLAGCSGDADVPPEQTTVVISEAEEPGKPPIEVRGFAVTPEPVRVGQPATVTVDLKEPYPSRRIRVDWHGPDGWVVDYTPIDSTKTRVTLTAPPEIFNKAGRYRAVLRAGITDLAEQWVTAAK